MWLLASWQNFYPTESPMYSDSSSRTALSILQSAMQEENLTLHLAEMYENFEDLFLSRKPFYYQELQKSSTFPTVFYVATHRKFTLHKSGLPSHLNTLG
jgi:hypothetical protein